MLSIAARRLAVASRGTSTFRFGRASSSIALDKSHTKAQLADLTPLDTTTVFSEYSDPGIRSQLSKLREMENELIANMTTKSEPVDWAYWEKNIDYPGVVSELRNIHESLPLPDVEMEKATRQKTLEELFNPIIAELMQLAKESEAEAVELEERVAEVSYLNDNVAKLSVDEFLEKYPSVKKSLEDDIANNRWFVNE